MNIEVCKRCNRHLFFTLNNERFVCGEREKFHCYKDVDILDFEFGCLNVCTHRLKDGKWKRFKLTIFQDVILTWDITKWINKKFEKYKLENMRYDCDSHSTFKCPYELEHKIKDWIENES